MYSWLSIDGCSGSGFFSFISATTAVTISLMRLEARSLLDEFFAYIFVLWSYRTDYGLVLEQRYVEGMRLHNFTCFLVTKF